MMNLEKLTNLEDVTLDVEATHPVTGEKAKDVFCTGWPVAKKSLELIYATVKNPIVKLIVNIVITVGDGMANKFCGSEETTATDQE